jgi:hypothetical protein
MMKMLHLRILVALVGFTALGITAKAQTIDQIAVTIPFEFVAAGKILPAGTYRVTRISNERWEGLLLSSPANRSSAFLHPVYVERSHSDNARVSFQQAGDQQFLIRIDSGDNVFTLPVSRVAILEASAKSHTGAVSGSSAGSN